MINPNKTYLTRGTLVEITRRKDGSIVTLTVELDSGKRLESALGVEHKTISVGERVQCWSSYRITSERYVIDKIRRIAKKRGES